ncbi:hypothetical protein ACS5PK_04475 [Roseateles sp. DB2]
MSTTPRRPGLDATPQGQGPATIGPLGWAGSLALGLLGLTAWLLGPPDSAPAPAASRPGLPASTAAPAVAPPNPAGLSASAARPATAQAPSPALSVRVLALRRDSRGRWLARLQLGQEAPRLALVGDVVAPGLRIEHMAPGGITLRRGLQLEHLSFDGPVEASPTAPVPQRPPAPSVIVSPPGQEAPSSSSVERAIQRAAWQAGYGSGQQSGH